MYIYVNQKIKIMKKQFIVIEKGYGDEFIVDDLKVLIEEMYGEYNDKNEDSFYKAHKVFEVIGEIKELN
jgi:hypothetical protein